MTRTSPPTSGGPTPAPSSSSSSVYSSTLRSQARAEGHIDFVTIRIYCFVDPNAFLFVFRPPDPGKIRLHTVIKFYVFYTYVEEKIFSNFMSRHKMSNSRNVQNRNLKPFINHRCCHCCVATAAWSGGKQASPAAAQYIQPFILSTKCYKLRYFLTHFKFKV